MARSRSRDRADVRCLASGCLCGWPRRDDRSWHWGRGHAFLLACPTQPLDEPRSERLSLPELEVLRLISSGRSNVAIARTLVLAVSTVKSPTNNIFGKLQVTSHSEAILRPREMRLLSPRYPFLSLKHPPCHPPSGWMPLHLCRSYALRIGRSGCIPMSWSTHHGPHDRDVETRASTHVGPYSGRSEQEAVTRHASVAMVGWKNDRRTAAPGHGACRDTAWSRSESKGRTSGKPSTDRTDGGCRGLQAAHLL